MRYSYDDGPPPEDYPGLTGLAKKTGLTKRIVQDTLKALEYKGIIKKQARYMARKKAHLSNLYIVRDVTSMWLPDTINNSMDLDITDAINRSIDLLHDRGYICIRCLSPAKKYKLYKSSINKSIHFVQRSLSSSTRGQRVTAQLNLSRE